LACTGIGVAFADYKVAYDTVLLSHGVGDFVCAGVLSNTHTASNYLIVA
jgi:hypothetical protein